MPSLSSLWLFVVAALALCLTPGPAVLYITTRALSQGRAAGFFSALGVAVGSVVHVAAATLGLSALLVSSALAFELVKFLGAAYLIWLGVRRILSKDGGETAASLPKRSLPAVFRQGVVVNLLNPKTALFFLAFLPQFIDPARGKPAPQILFYGLLFTVIGLTTDSLYAVAADSLGGRLRDRPGILTRGRYVSGSVYIGLGLATAFGASRKGD